MKHLPILTLSMMLFSAVEYSHCSIDQKFDAKLNTLQETLAMLISQSDLDPEVSQDIMDKANDLGYYVQNNIQQDLKEIQVATGLTSLLETADKMAQNANMANIHDALGTIKYSARANAVHKLIMGAYPGAFKEEAYYTDPYTESIGFIINDYALNAVFNYLTTILTPTALGTLLQLNSTSPAKNWIIRLAAGIASHYAWSLQKKLAAEHLLQIQQQQNS
jgi:hypothetical protein